MDDPGYEALLAQLSEAFLGLCDEAEMLRCQAEEIQPGSPTAKGTYQRAANQKVAELHALERYIEARQAILSYIEKSAKEAALIPNTRVSAQRPPSLYAYPEIPKGLCPERRKRF